MGKNIIKLILFLGQLLLFSSCDLFLSLNLNEIPSSSSSSGSIPENGLIAYYPLNGDANDASGNGNDGTVNNVNFSTDRFGNINKACGFNGLTSYIQTPIKLSGQVSCTFAAWVYPTNFVSDGNHNQYTIVSQFDGGYAYDLFKISYGFNGNMNFNTEVYGNDKAYSGLSITNVWYFVVGTYDGSVSDPERQKIYVNGVLAGTNIGPTVLNTQSTYALRIGCSPDLINNVFSGYIDDVRIYSRALSDIEIQTLYHEGGW